MAGTYNYKIPGAPVVFTDEQGRHQILLSSGEIMRPVILTQVTDEINETPVLLVKVFCNLATDLVSAREIIAQYPKD